MTRKCVQLLQVCLLFLIFEVCLIHTHNHDNDHGHSHYEEPPSFKYSKSANEKWHHDGDHHSHEHASPSHKHSKLEDVNVRSPALTGSDLWMYAMGSTLLISAAPFFILFFVPLDNTEQKQPLLKILLAFASGGLLGDAFLHLIPHASMAVGDGHAHSHSHGHATPSEEHGHNMSVGLWVLAGIVTFLLVEKSVRILKGGHGHSHGPPKKSEVEDKKRKKEERNLKETKETENSTKHKPAPNEVKVAGYLNLAADFSHNFTDGLAIGSSYLAGNTVGIVTTITILLHEVPHEIGDFAILLQSGVSRRNAMLLQLTTALGAVAGTAISLLVQNSMMATNWILPFTAGGFIYIALVSVIPELLDEEKPSFLQTFLQVTAMLTGVYLMVLIADYE